MTLLIQLFVFIMILATLFIVVKAISILKLHPKIVKLITLAEKIYNHGENKEKFNYVFDKLYNGLVPNGIKLLVPEREMKAIIQEVFDMVKVALDYTEDTQIDVQEEVKLDGK